MTEQKTGWSIGDYDMGSSWEYEEMVDEFEQILPHDPKTSDWLEAAQKTGNIDVVRNSEALDRLIHEVTRARLERKIKHDMIEIIKESGDEIGLVQLMGKIDALWGQAGANASIGLVYVLQEKGVLEIQFQPHEYRFVKSDEPWLESDVTILDEQVMVRRKRVSERVGQTTKKIGQKVSSKIVSKQK